MADIDALPGFIAEADFVFVGFALAVMGGIPALGLAHILALAGFDMAGRALPVCVGLGEGCAAALVVEAFHHGKKGVSVAVSGDFEGPGAAKARNLDAIQSIATLER